MGWTRTGKAVASLAALAALAAACGDDDDDDAASDTEAFCEVATEISEQEDFPTVEQLERYRDTAPEEIKEAANLVTTEFIAATEAGDVFAAFEQPGMDEAFEDVLEPYEAEECGIEQDDEGEDEPDQDPSVTVLDPAATRVDVAATDFAFAFTPPAAGRTSFVMANQGAERHVMLLFKLSEGSTIEEALASEGDEGIDEEWESDTAAAGEEAVLTADLTAGDYGMICYIPAAEGGEPHFELGMQETFTVQ